MGFCKGAIAVLALEVSAKPVDGGAAGLMYTCRCAGLTSVAGMIKKQRTNVD